MMYASKYLLDSSKCERMRVKISIRWLLPHCRVEIQPSYSDDIGEYSGWLGREQSGIFRECSVKITLTDVIVKASVTKTLGLWIFHADRRSRYTAGHSRSGKIRFDCAKSDGLGNFSSFDLHLEPEYLFFTKSQSQSFFLNFFPLIRSRNSHG